MNASITTPEPLPRTEVSSRVLSPCRRIVLAGFMGAGKTTVGQLLARQLDWAFLDLDRHIEDRTGRTVPEIFAADGESRFRRLESAALANALRQQQVVLALGGGAPETPANRLLLEQTPSTLTVFLHAPFPVLFDRCLLQSVDRPNLRDAGAAAARFAARLPLYRRISRFTVETESDDPESTARTIAKVISSAM